MAWHLTRSELYHEKPNIANIKICPVLARRYWILVYFSRRDLPFFFPMLMHFSLFIFTLKGYWTNLKYAPKKCEVIWNDNFIQYHFSTHPSLYPCPFWNYNLGWNYHLKYITLSIEIRQRH
jgi:hypothetical protein